MAAFAVSAVLIGAADVMQVCGGFDDQQIRAFGDADAPTQAMHAQGMVPVMASSNLRKVAPGLFANMGQQGQSVVRQGGRGIGTAGAMGHEWFTVL